MNDNKKILDYLKKETGSNNIRLGGCFNYYQNDDVTIEFTNVTQMGINTNTKGKNKNAKNMQNPNACFEGWAVALYTFFFKKKDKKGKVYLKALDDIKEKDYSLEKIHNNPHFARFLYRALRFSQQYEWFELDEKLQRVVNDFGEYLKKDIFTNKYFKSASASKTSFESQIEGKFACGGKRTTELQGKLKEKDVMCKQINRQLPVGLSSSEARDFFPSGHSAIDLWGISEKTFCSIELKAHKKNSKSSSSKMIGTITEIFFYSNFSYDMFVMGNNENIKTGFKLDNKPVNTELYKDLIYPEQKLEKVKGFLLLDKDSIHPLFDYKEDEESDVIAVMNNQSVSIPIQYGIIQYDI